MSERINPREVLAYLNELGYTNITAHQLKEFIKDLKKIIKYDSRYGGMPEKYDREYDSHYRRTPGTAGGGLYYNGEARGEEAAYCECPESYDKENHNPIDSRSHKQSVNSASQKNVQNTSSTSTRQARKDKHIAVHIYDTKCRCRKLDHDHCIHVKPLSEINTQQAHDKSKISSNLISTSASSKVTESTLLTTIPPCSSGGLVPSRASKSSSRDRKSKVTFLRPAIAKSCINRCDPVALYHYYQSEWKKTKIPGQDSRDDLRWAIRARMLSGPRMFTYLLVSIFFLLLVRIFWKFRNLPPGPWGLPILGYLPWLNPKAPYLTLTELAKKYGPIYSLSLGSVCTVVVTDPKMIKSLFAKDATTGRAPLYLTHGIMNGYGLICAEGDLWKDQRKFVHSCLRTLGATKIGTQKKKMEQLILKHVEEFIGFIKDNARDKAIDPLEALRHSLGSIMNDIVFGTHWPRDDQTWLWLQDLQEEGTKHIGVAGPLNFLPFLRFLPMFKRPMSFLIEGKLKTHRFYEKLIQEEQNVLLNRSRSADLDTNNTYTNLIQGFLIEREKRRNTADADKYYNDQQFYHLLADVFGAGLDTTLTTLRWLILYLTLNESVQTTARNEIQSVLNGRLPTLDDINSLPFIEACIAETQRIRSVVPVGIPHGALADVEIEDYIIPKGSMIIPLQWAIHMDDTKYKEPGSFNPHNFLDGEGRFCKNEYFIPFQNGKRMCVGDELARMLLFFFAVEILRNFVLTFEDRDDVDTEGECGITLTPKPYKIRFKNVSE